MQKLPVVKMNLLMRFIQAQKRIFGKSLTQIAMDMTAMTQNIYHKSEYATLSVFDILAKFI